MLRAAACESARRVLLMLLSASPPNELGVDRENTRGNLHFLKCFSRAKGAALGGLEAHLLCLGRGVAPAAADLAGAGLTEHGGGGGSRWSGALKRV